MGKKYLAIIGLALFFSIRMAWAGFNKVGTSGAQFLKLGVGARGTSLGGAFAALADDAEAAYWNPAGLANIGKREVNFSHLSWIAEVNLDALIYVQKISQLGTIALSFIQLGTKDMPVTTTQQQEGTGEMFTYRDLAIGLSYSRYLSDAFSVGLTVRYIDEQIYSYHARGLAFDIGTQYHIGLQGLCLAFVIRNFGQDLRFKGSYINTKVVQGTNTMLSEERNFEAFPLPLQFVAGIRYDFLDNDFIRVRVVVDALHFNDYSERIHLGAETWFKDILALRAGYKFNYREEGLSLGIGLQSSLYNFLIKLGYAYSDLGMFQEVHSFSIDFTF
jgi:hypothetical protein